jgi:hypothetical protein
MIGRLLYRSFYWTYDRGSWQWDISCLVFLLIIFTTPSDFLSHYTLHAMTPGEIHRFLLEFLGFSAS